MSSPTADDTLHPSPQPRRPRPKRHIPYIDGTGEVEEPTYNRNSVVEEPEELELDSTEPTPHVARSSFFSHSRSPSSHRTARTWRRVCKASSLAIVSLRTSSPTATVCPQSHCTNRRRQQLRWQLLRHGSCSDEERPEALEKVCTEAEELR